MLFLFIIIIIGPYVNIYIEQNQKSSYSDVTLSLTQTFEGIQHKSFSLKSSFFLSKNLSVIFSILPFIFIAVKA